MKILFFFVRGEGGDCKTCTVEVGVTVKASFFFFADVAWT